MALAMKSITINKITKRHGRFTLFLVSCLLSICMYVHAHVETDADSPVNKEALKVQLAEAQAQRIADMVQHPMLNPKLPSLSDPYKGPPQSNPPQKNIYGVGEHLAEANIDSEQVFDPKALKSHIPEAQKVT